MKLVVDPVELHTAAQNFGQMASDYTNIYNRMINAVSNMGEAWNAADNLAFVEQITGFCEDLKNMAGHLEQASKALDLQAKNYENTRDDNISNVKKLAN